MKPLFRVIALTAVFALPAFAQDSHQHGEDKEDGAMGMHDQPMASMHENMQEMHALMEKIKSENNPEKRLQLMEKHMDAMQTGMHKMNMNMGMSHQSGDKGQNMNMENCMGMMREHKSMIQGMMDQMKEHQAQEKKLRKHIHKK